MARMVAVPKADSVWEPSFVENNSTVATPIEPEISAF
jgi:hypothetical protein